MGDVHLKLLIPCFAAGAIIGRGGEAVESIKRQTGAHLKMSKANDFYPGTNERVCLIIGTIKACMQLHDYIMKKVDERSESMSSGNPETPFLSERFNQVKILVPNSTAGMIIGKSGSFIKQIKEMSGASVQISQRSKELKLLERCIIVSGDLNERRTAVAMILSKIAEDPDSASCPNCSYANVYEPVPNACQTNLPVASDPVANTYPGAEIANYGNYNAAVCAGPITTDPVSSSRLPANLPNNSAIFGAVPKNLCEYATSVLNDPQTNINLPLVKNLGILPPHASHLFSSLCAPCATPNIVPIPTPLDPTGSLSWFTQFIQTPTGTAQQNSLYPGNVVGPQAVVTANRQYPLVYGSETPDKLTSALRTLRSYGLLNAPPQMNYSDASPLQNVTPGPYFIGPPPMQTYGPANNCVGIVPPIEQPVVSGAYAMLRNDASQPSSRVLPDHTRYWSGGSSDSALTSSLMSVHIQSPNEDMMPGAVQSPPSHTQSCLSIFSPCSTHNPPNGPTVGAGQLPLEVAPAVNGDVQIKPTVVYDASLLQGLPIPPVATSTSDAARFFVYPAMTPVMEMSAGFDRISPSTHYPSASISPPAPAVLPQTLVSSITQPVWSDISLGSLRPKTVAANFGYYSPYSIQSPVNQDPLRSQSQLVCSPVNPTGFPFSPVPCPVGLTKSSFPDTLPRPSCSTGGILMVGTAKQMRVALSLLQLQNGQISSGAENDSTTPTATTTTTTGSGSSVSTSNHFDLPKAMWSIAANGADLFTSPFCQGTTSFTSDSPLRLDTIEPFCPPAQLTAATCSGQPMTMHYRPWVWHAARRISRTFCRFITSPVLEKQALSVEDLAAREPAYNPYSSSTSWRNPEELATFLSKRIIAACEHFVVLDKPAGLSVFGHSLASQEALRFFSPECSSVTGNLSIKDCLPHLASLLYAQKPENVAGVTSIECERDKDNSQDEFDKAPKLFICDPLPAAYSGLVVLARTEAYAEAAKRFYHSAMTENPLWKLYQRLLAVCLGKPFQEHAEGVSFPIASYRIADNIFVGYKPVPEEISRRKKSAGLVLTKHVSHRSLVSTAPDASLIELRTNSTYRGLPEVYLLYEGCSIVGELLQSSRLVGTGMVPIVLPPFQVKLASKIPLALSRRLGNPKFHNIPVHLHRTQVYLPAPFKLNKSPKNERFRPLTREPVGNIRVCRSPSEISATVAATPALSWTQLTRNSDGAPTVHEFVLTCSSPNLPTYFSHTMNRLGLQFDYSAWSSKM
ncbi:unnamed protein product [Calicophoron daubneyi]|uniref:K Homology domain-containing protein n=1 Tax=Calicophoron daubneyi TaxID=300641 RepID=A0AAV2T1S6_CALDB